MRPVAETPKAARALDWKNDSVEANSRTYAIFSEHVRGEPRFYFPRVQEHYGDGRWRPLGDPSLAISVDEPVGYTGSKQQARRWAALHARVVFLTRKREAEWVNFTKLGYALSVPCGWCGEMKACRGATRRRMACHVCYVAKGAPKGAVREPAL